MYVTHLLAIEASITTFCGTLSLSQFGLFDACSITTDLNKTATHLLKLPFICLNQPLIYSESGLECT